MPRKPGFGSFAVSGHETMGSVSMKYRDPRGAPVTLMIFIGRSFAWRGNGESITNI